MEQSSNYDVEAKNANYDRCIGFPHTIKKGDTLYKLSKQYNVKVSALILANPYVNIYNLQVGDTICIPRLRPVVIPVVPGRPDNQNPSQRPERPDDQAPPPRPRPNRPASPEEGILPPMIPDTPASPEEGILPTPGILWEMESQEEPQMHMEDRLMGMTVRALLDEWDISYSMLENVLDIIKKLKRIL